MRLQAGGVRRRVRATPGPGDEAAEVRAEEADVVRDFGAQRSRREKLSSQREAAVEIGRRVRGVVAVWNRNGTGVVNIRPVLAGAFSADCKDSKKTSF